MSQKATAWPVVSVLAGEERTVWVIKEPAVAGSDRKKLIVNSLALSSFVGWGFFLIMQQ